MKTRNLVIIVASVILLVLGLVAVVFFMGSSDPLSIRVSGQNLPPQHIETSFQGQEVLILTNYDGRLVGGQRIDSPFTGATGVKSVVCGSDDGDTFVETQVTGGNQLDVFVTSSTQGAGCGNYAEWSLVLPKGKLTVDCSLSAPEPRFGEAFSLCKVLGNTVRASTMGNTDDSSKTKNQRIEIITSENQLVLFRLQSQSLWGADASARAVIRFSQNECNVDSDCPEDEIISERCIGDEISSVIKSSSCINSKCVSSTDNELESCGGSCEDVDGIPTCSEAKPILQEPVFIWSVIGIIAIAGVGLFIFLRRRNR